MAYKGGTITQPILGNYIELGKMLLQGSSDIANINMANNKLRDSQLGAFTEQASKLVATGVGEADRIYQQAAQYGKQSIREAILRNRSGEGSLSDVSFAVNAANTQMSKIVNYSEIQAENLKEIQEGVKDGTVDKLSFDSYGQNFLRNTKNTIAYTLGKGISGDLNLITITQNQNGKSTTQMQPLNTAIDINSQIIPQYQLNSNIKNWSNNLGNRLFSYDPQNPKANGKSISYVFNQRVNGLTGGADLYSRSTIPQIFPEYVKSVEQFVTGEANLVNKDNVMSIISSIGGGTMNTKGVPKDMEEAQEYLSAKIIGPDGEKVSDYLYYNSLGKKLEFKQNPFLIETDDNGQMIINEDNVKLAQAVLRQQANNSFNVTAEEFRIPDKSKTTDSSSEEAGLSVATYGVGGVNGYSLKDGAYVMNKFILSAFQDNYQINPDGDSAGNIKAIEDYYRKTDYSSLPNDLQTQADRITSLAKHKNFYNQLKNAEVYVGATTNTTIEKIGLNVSNTSTLNDRKMTSIQDIVVLKNPVIFDDGSTKYSYTMHFIGDEDLAESSYEQKAKSTESGDISLEQKSESQTKSFKSGVGISKELNSNDVRSIFNYMLDNNAYFYEKMLAASGLEATGVKKENYKTELKKGSMLSATENKTIMTRGNYTQLFFRYLKGLSNSNIQTVKTNESTN